MRFRGLLYRAINPLYAREPLSGRGAELYGGRFNPKGMLALYTSLSILAALREANQAGHLQPTTLVSYEADIDGIFDSRDRDALQQEGIEAHALADDGWRIAARNGKDALTQALARRLKSQGHNGLLVRSSAKGSTAEDLNLVLWHWGNSVPTRLEVIDDENRLG